MSPPFEDLKELARMLDEGKITKPEYESIKRDLIREMGMAPSDQRVQLVSDDANTTQPSPVQVAIGVLLALLFAYFIYAWLSDDGPPSATQSEARLIAVADTGASSPSDFTIAQYEAALAELNGSCTLESGQTHGDLALTAVKLLAQDGVDLTALQMLLALGEASDSMRSTRIKCSQAYAMASVLILQDQ